MSNQPRRDPLLGFIAVIEMIVLFLIGVLGNNISALLTIPTTLLVIITGMGLLILAIISYANSTAHGMPTFDTGGFRRLIPKSMLGIFPFGVALGAIVGILVALDGGDPGEYSGVLSMSYDELIGVSIGVAFSLIFALFVEGHLGGMVAISFGLAFPSVLLALQPGVHSVILTYLVVHPANADRISGTPQRGAICERDCKCAT